MPKWHFDVVLDFNEYQTFRITMIGLVYHVLILGVCFAHFDPNVLSNALHMHHITPHAHLSCFLHFNDITCFSTYNMIV